MAQIGRRLQPPGLATNGIGGGTIPRDAVRAPERQPFPSRCRKDQEGDHQLRIVVADARRSLPT